MAGVHTTKKEKEKRIFTIQGWIISGVPDYLILKNIEQQYHVSRRQSKYDLQRAYSLWTDNQEATIEQKRALKIAKLKQDICSMGAEFKTTPQGMAVLLNYEKEINKLEALYPATKVILQGDKDHPIVISNAEQREARIAELIAKAQIK